MITMDLEYYYNNIPGIGQTRSNLVYTSLISKDKKTFVKWFYNDQHYHKGQNEILDPDLMQSKWDREIKFIVEMAWKYRDKVPKILEIDNKNKKLYLEIDGIDFWNRANCSTENYDSVLPDWQDQMIRIITAHKSLGLYKFSMHPSSYFIVDGQLKSINYFFCYHESEGDLKISDHLSHIYSTRQQEIKNYTDTIGLSWDNPCSMKLLESVCWQSFKNNYPSDFIDRARCLI